MSGHPSASITETLITAIDTLGGPAPTSYGLGELLEAFDVALGNSSGGGGGTVLEFFFTYNSVNGAPTTNLAVGVPFFVPVVGTWLRNWWVEISIPWNGLTPKFDLGFLSSGNLGMLQAVGANPVNMWQGDGGMPGNAQFGYSPQSASWDSALQSLGFTTGPPVVRREQQFTNSGAETLFLIVSQDGTTNAAVAASLTAHVAPVGGTSPYVITTGTNDNFFYNKADPTLGGGGAAQERFTIPGGSYTGLPALEGAITNAVGQSSDTFGEYCAVSDNGVKLVFTATGSLVPPGAASNGNFISSGTHDALAGLGFTGANIFANGLGGDPGATGGLAVLYLDIVTPVP